MNTTQPQTHTKTCTKCGGEPQPLKNFNKQSAAPDGHASWCRSCLALYMRKRGGFATGRMKQISSYPAIPTTVPSFEAECYTGDIRGTKMWHNRHFVSGDGGYKQYIENLQPQQPLPSYPAFP